MSSNRRKNHPFKGLPKERAIFEAALSFAKRVGHLVSEDYFSNAVVKGLKAGELQMVMGSEGFSFEAIPKPKKKSYDELVAEVAELRKQMGEST